VLQGDPLSSSSCAAIEALQEAMIRCRSYALVRFVKRTDADPWLAALVPIPLASEDGSAVKGFYIQRLPCAEDIRDFAFPSLTDSRFGKAVSKAQHKCMGNFVSGMTVQNLSDIGAGDVTVFNPAFPRLVGEILKATGIADKPVPMLSPMEVADPLLEKSREYSRLLEAEFPLTVVDKSRKKRKIYWNDVDSSGASAAAQEIGSAQTGVAVRIMLPFIASRDVFLQETKVDEAVVTLNPGSTNPVEDFNRDIASGSKLVQLVSFQNMVRLIIDVVEEGGTTAHYRKAISCIKVGKF
jgi:hypothetical protein